MGTGGGPLLLLGTRGEVGEVGATVVVDGCVVVWNMFLTYSVSVI